MGANANFIEVYALNEDSRDFLLKGNAGAQ
jgi:hypothetical protein